jgi:hypothetical protein
MFNVAVLANTNLLAAPVSPQYAPSMLRLTLALSVATVVKVLLTRGAATVTMYLNESVPLVANSIYAFDMPWRANDIVNVQIEAAGNVLLLNVDETVVGG